MNRTGIGIRAAAWLLPLAVIGTIALLFYLLSSRSDSDQVAGSGLAQCIHRSA
jgi:hypothetical protein